MIKILDTNPLAFWSQTFSCGHDTALGIWKDIDTVNLVYESFHLGVVQVFNKMYIYLYLFIFCEIPWIALTLMHSFKTIKGLDCLEFLSKWSMLRPLQKSYAVDPQLNCLAHRLVIPWIWVHHSSPTGRKLNNYWINKIAYHRQKLKMFFLLFVCLFG